MVIEMTRNQRNVDVAAFADRLAVVHGFEHRKQARVFLDQARDGVQIASAGVWSSEIAIRKSGSRSLNCGIDVRG